MKFYEKTFINAATWIFPSTIMFIWSKQKGMEFIMLDAMQITKEIKNNNVRELPLYFPPPLYYSLHAAITLSIILSNHKTHEWFYTNFIQLTFNNEYYKYPKEHSLHIYPIREIRSGQKGASLLVNEVIINDNIFLLRQNELIENIIHWINTEYYIISSVDVTKLPGTRYYLKKPFTHGVMCFGYDLDKKILKFIDFDQAGKISIIEVGFNDYIKAFYSVELLGPLRGKCNSVCLCKLNDNIKFNIDISTIKDLLYDYLHSVNTSKRYNLILPESINNTWGLEVYQALVKFCKISLTNFNYIDYRPFHCLYEHKILMKNRLEYLESINLLNPCFNMSKKLFSIRNDANTLRLMIIKYNQKRDNSIIDRIEQVINDMCNYENVVLNDVYDKLIRMA